MASNPRTSVGSIRPGSLCYLSDCHSTVSQVAPSYRKEPHAEPLTVTLQEAQRAASIRSAPTPPSPPRPAPHQALASRLPHDNYISCLVAADSGH